MPRTGCIQGTIQPTMFRTMRKSAPCKSICVAICHIQFALKPPKTTTNKYHFNPFWHLVAFASGILQVSRVYGRIKEWDMKQWPHRTWAQVCGNPVNVARHAGRRIKGKSRTEQNQACKRWCTSVYMQLPVSLKQHAASRCDATNINK